MYTGGFFAGGGNTLFYVQDESGGTQVFADDGDGVVRVNIGDRVRVTGAVTLYRDWIEVIPSDLEAGIEIIEPAAAAVEPAVISAQANETEAGILGRLNMIEGTVTGIADLTFDFEVNVQDAAGDTTLVLIEKQTGVTAEPLEIGKLYRFTGISETESGTRQLKPRLQTDIVEIFPPVLSVNMRAANSVLPGEEIVYHITAVNHTPDPLTNLIITAVPPTENASLRLDVAPGTPFVWTVDELAGNGESVTFEYSVIVNVDAEGMIEAPAVTAVADQWPEAATTQPFLTFIGEGVPIWAIQGAGDTSPYVRDGVTTVGVVTAVFPDLQGFWIQETESDDNPLTSAAIFVLFPEVGGLVQMGDLVQVEGTVRELFTQTTIEPPDAKGIMVLSSGNDLPEATAVIPLANLDETLAYYETLEGMLVQTTEPTIVAAASNHFGEYVIIPQSWGEDTLRRGENTGYFLFVDDGSTVAHEDQSTVPYVVNRGDQVSKLVGPLAYSCGYYKIEPIVMPEIVVVERPWTTFPAPSTNEFSIATFNVENLFDLVDPHPASPPRPTLEQYRTKLEKIAQTIIAMGTPTVIAMQEVENIDILESLVELDSLAEFNYQPYLLEGRDSRGIDNGYLVRGDMATVEGVSQVDGPDDLISRLPLMITVTVHLEAGDQTLILLNNHFTALSAGEEATEPQRTGQAALNAAAIEQVRNNNPAALFVVMGDLNSFYDTLPLHTIQDAGLQHVYEFVEGDVLPYSYIFEGRAQTLDHMLVSPGLFGEITAVSTLHLGTDYAIPSPDDASARHTSDHDPLVVMFSFE
jgi:predicted extracellular nuclease